MSASENSHDVVDSHSGTSLKGYLNEQEFALSVVRNYRKWAGLGFGAAILVAILESLSTTYTGPYAPLLIALAGVVGGYVKSVRTAKALMKEGQDDVSP